ncbi:hypothetical protein ACNHKD_06025 [Methylocystis sp. JAN1]|uniref:hypothetical protein n=1 Tax=Methylocystis sp. JAN1 TaxID=3397211 RepID=UPI003FA25C54
MKYFLALLIVTSTMQLAVALPRHDAAERARSHASAVSSATQDGQSTASYSGYLGQREEGQGLLPIENQQLRGLLFVLGGLAGPVAFLFAAP